MCERKGALQDVAAACYHAATVVDQRGPSSETPHPGAAVTDVGGSGWSKQEVEMHQGTRTGGETEQRFYTSQELTPQH